MKDLTLRLLDQRNAHIFGKSPLRFSSLSFCISKFCYRCGSLKSLDQFNKSSKAKYGRQVKCRSCQKNMHKLKASEYAARKRKKISEDPEYRERHLESKRKHNRKSKERHRLYCIEWNKRNKDKRHQYYITYRNKDIEKLRKSSRESGARRREKQKAYALKNKKHLRNKARIKQRERTKNDLSFRISCNLRKRLINALKSKGTRKAFRTFELLGCSAKEFRKHLESKFQAKMTWENYGKGGWQMDHIIPCAGFDLTDPYQQKVCFHWSNIQPLWAAENRSKGDSIKPGAQPNLPL